MRGIVGLPFIYTNAEFPMHPVRIVTHGDTFPRPPFNRESRTVSTVAEIENICESVYLAWSRFSEQLASDADVRTIRVIRKLKAALRSSQDLRRAVLNFHNGDASHSFSTWARSEALPIVIQSLGSSIPWHLLYCGPDLTSNYEDAEMECLNLLGILCPVVYQIVLDKEARAESSESPSDMLVSVGGKLPGFDHLNDAILEVEGTIREHFPDAKRKRLHTLPEHEKHFDSYDGAHDMWFVVSHGVEGNARFGQRSIQLAERQLLSGLALQQIRREKHPEDVFKNAAAVLLLTCRAGILSQGWDLPEEILHMGASTVIAPHSDVSLHHSLALASSYFNIIKVGGVLPSVAFAMAQKGFIDPILRCHANLYAVAFTDEKGLTKEFFRAPAIPSATSQG